MGISLIRPSQILRVASRTAHGVASIVKTEALRMDRLPDAEYEARLEVCRHCPGGHVTFKDDGSVHTCGEMIAAMKRESKGTCGCILRHKARDAKEQCPFGYWPKPKYQWLSDRRKFIIRSAAVLGALAIAPVRALAADPPPSQGTGGVRRYIKISRCSNAKNLQSNAQWLQCDGDNGGCGKKVGQIFRGADTNCYALSGIVEPQDGSTTAPDGKKADVQQWLATDATCDDCYCQIKDGSDPTLTGTDCDGNAFADGVPYVKMSGDTCWHKLAKTYGYSYDILNCPDGTFYKSMSGSATWQLIGEEPDWPYGWQSDTDGATIYLMNNLCQWQFSTIAAAEKVGGSSPIGGYQDNGCDFDIVPVITNVVVTA